MPTDADAILAQLTIPSPCSARWESMPGDNLVRSCNDCGKRVYNLSAMSSAQVRSLLVEHGDNLCGRLVNGQDGFTLDGWTHFGHPSETRRSVRFRLRSLMAGIAGIAGALGLARLVWSAMPEPNEAVGGVCQIPRAGSAPQPTGLVPPLPSDTPPEPREVAPSESPASPTRGEQP